MTEAVGGLPKWALGWTKTPSWVSLDRRIDDGARSTLTYVLSRVFSESGFYPLSATEIARDRGKCEREIRRHLLQLRSAGYLVARLTKFGGVLEYGRGPSMNEPPPDEAVTPGPGGHGVTRESGPHDSAVRPPMTRRSAPHDQVVRDQKTTIRLGIEERETSALAPLDASQNQRADEDPRAVLIQKIKSKIPEDFKAHGVHLSKVNRGKLKECAEQLAEFGLSKSGATGTRANVEARRAFDGWITDPEIIREGHPLSWLATSPEQYWRRFVDLANGDRKECA